MWPFTASDAYFVIIVALLLPHGMVEALRTVELILPPGVRQGENVVLKCSYNLDGDILYSLKWYKGHYEFYRYTPEHNPPIKIFALPGIRVDSQSSNATQVTLENVQESASGEYSCEVAADAPTFWTSYAHGNLNVVAIPDSGPSINGIENRYRIGDILQGNCTIGYSRPAANLTWIFNDQLFLPENITVGTENSFTEIDLVVTAEHFVGGKMNIKCVAEIYNVYSQSDELVIDELIEEILTTTDRSTFYAKIAESAYETNTNMTGDQEVLTTTNRAYFYDKYAEPVHETNMNMTKNQEGNRRTLVTYGKSYPNDLSNSLKSYIDDKFEEIKDLIIKENQGILKVLVTNAALMRQLQEQFNNKKNFKFPIKTTAELEELEKEINDENFEHYVSLIKKIIFPHTISQSLDKLLDEKLGGSYSYDGGYGKFPFKNFANINKLFARVYNDEEYVKAIRSSFLIYNRENK